MSGGGGMVTFEVEGTGEDARRASEAMRLFTLATSLGGVESLVSIPVLTSHAMIPAEARARMGVTEQMIRLSVGIENADDLIADLEHALEAVAAPQQRAGGISGSSLAFETNKSRPFLAGISLAAHIAHLDQK